MNTEVGKFFGEKAVEFAERRPALKQQRGGYGGKLHELDGLKGKQMCKY